MTEHGTGHDSPSQCMNHVFSTHLQVDSGWAEVGRPRPNHRHAVLGHCARFVRCQEGYRSKGVHGVKIFNEHLPTKEATKIRKK